MILLFPSVSPCLPCESIFPGIIGDLLQLHEALAKCLNFSPEPEILEIWYKQFVVSTLRLKRLPKVGTRESDSQGAIITTTPVFVSWGGLDGH